MALPARFTKSERTLLINLVQAELRRICGDAEFSELSTVLKKLRTLGEVDDIDIDQMYIRTCLCQSPAQVERLMSSNLVWCQWYFENVLASWHLTPKALVENGGIDTFLTWLNDKRKGTFE
ncbi:hypothetical protein GCM10011369_18750 [Neiella marina]|uniref:Uncharacterized protein n=1 Tax=Neiella marina TaxID=508461 RepID=A0A8J2U537_9GAMM|nr:hypothetical protein [Neiella marina]GGA77155.1 hypothetical protein GCM10011369_18750 [Neiella marina]